MFGVDATRLHDHPNLKDKKFDIILFTFPHTGVPNFSHGSIEGNKQLIRDFLKSAQHILKQDGEINITLKTTAPYDRWEFPDFAEYEVEPKSQHNFNAQLFPGYIHRSTVGHSHSVVNSGAARSYVFGRKKQTPQEQAQTFIMKRDNHDNGVAKALVLDRKQQSQVKARTMLAGTNRKHSDTENEDRDGDTISPSILFTLSIEFSYVYEQDLKTFITEILSSSSNAICNVLDIRRQFPEAVRPDTRQLNRVLYQMESQKQLKKGPPKGCNQKPTWKLAEE